MIIREDYLRKLIKLKNKDIIKVVTGIRRCGKSTLFKQYMEYLLSNGIEENQIISINFEDMDYYELLDAKKLYEYIKERLLKEKTMYIFLDEIQQVNEFERVVDSLYIKENIDIYITGSNAYLLSSELATLLSGRYITIEMLPISFKEYIGFLGDKTDLNKKYSDYLLYSSFPYSLKLNMDLELIQNYLEGIFNTVVLKDVVGRRNISDVFMLDSVIKFMFDNIGNITSTKRIADTMTSNGRKISTNTVESYLLGLVDSYILYRVNRYDIKGKQHLKTLEKYYAVDIGLRYFLLGNKKVDYGHILENIIYLELKRRGYTVNIGKVNEYEVDFVATRLGIVEYYQVALTTRDDVTLERELRPLKKISDHYKKILLTLDVEPDSYYDGILKRNALEFLIEE
ncbi:ATP-binding protein [Clostridiaceae bacterium HSG29]|nr:ATP-binding protein [Clostridiaceae bacterium HSG29]